MILTPTQIEERRAFCGGTDVPAIMGYSPFSNAWVVWAEKTNILTPYPGNASTRTGNRFEPAILDYAEEQLDEPLMRDIRRAATDCPISCQIDAIGLLTDIPVDAKTTGLEGPVIGEWGEPETDQIPHYIAIQMQCQMMVTQTDRCYVFCFIGGRGIVRFDLYRNDRIINHIKQFVIDWWDKHVIEGIKPEWRTPPRLESARRIIREPGTKTIFTTRQNRIVDNWERSKEIANRWKKIAERKQAKLLVNLGTNEGAELLGGRMLTHLEDKRGTRTLRLRK